jgi:glyoxylase-like metal-dependent hydrolase (beta-lactamase superfamily II)
MARSIGDLIGKQVVIHDHSLFPGGAGRVTSPDDFDSLMTDLERRIFDVYGDDTVVHPGHGLPTTLGVERPQLPEWWARRW